MASKLDMWKTALTEYENAHEVWVSDKSGDWAIHERYVDARDHIEGNAPYYLRTLLAVAEAARALKTAYSEAAVGVEDYELELGALFDALKAIE